MTSYVIIKYLTLDGQSDPNTGRSEYQDNTALVRVRLPFEKYHNPPAYDRYAMAARSALAAFDRYSLSGRFDDKTRPRNASVAGVFNADSDIADLFPGDVKRLEAVSNMRKLK